MSSFGTQAVLSRYSSSSAGSTVESDGGVRRDANDKLFNRSALGDLRPDCFCIAVCLPTLCMGILDPAISQMRIDHRRA